jgi:vitamin B12 transporter
VFLKQIGKVLSLTLCLVNPVFPQETGEYFSDDEALIDMPVMEGEGLTIVGTRETSQQMKTVSKEEIERAAAPDLASLLRETLNLGVTAYGGYGMQGSINLRGFDSDRVAFLIDGVPVNSPLSGDFDINTLNMDAIDHIEVIYGGSDSKYNISGSLGGVINIVTVKKQKPGLRFGGSLSNTAALPGSYAELNGDKAAPHWEDLADTQNAALFAEFGGERYSAQANLFANRAGNHFLYRDTIFNKTRRKEHSEVKDGGASFSVIRDLPDYARLLAGAALYYGDKNIPTSGYSRIFGRQTDFSTRENLALDAPRAFRDELAAEASFSHEWTWRTYDPPVPDTISALVPDTTSPPVSDTGSAVSRHDSHTVTAINRWAWYLAEKLTLRAGGDYRYAWLDSTDMGVRHRQDGGVYLTAELKAAQTLLVIPSVKAVMTDGGDGALTPVPKLGFLWNATESLVVKNNYFRSFKLPDFEDLYWTGGGMYGNPGLKSEDGWGADLGLSYHFAGTARVSAARAETTVFAQQTEDSIHWYNSTGTWRPENVGQAVFYGADTRLGATFPLSKGPFAEIGLSLSYQYLLSFLLSYGYDYASNKRIPYMPAHTLGASVSLPWKSGSLSLSAHYESARYADTANITELAPYCLLTVNASQKINGNVTVFAVARNALNQSYESFDDYPMPGMSVTIGLRVNVAVAGNGE